MTDTTRKPFNSGQFLADWTLRQITEQAGAWQGLTNEHIPSYQQFGN